MVYKMSADTNEQEKAVGGILTFQQAGWLTLGAFLFGGIFLPLASVLPPIIALVIAAPPGIILGCAFAFYRKAELTLYTYLLYRWQFRRKQKQLINDFTYQKVFQEECMLFQ